MEKNIIFVAAVTLIIGIGAGYVMGANKPAPVQTDDSTHGMHQVSNNMMENNGHNMNMADMMASMNAELEGKSGDAFDEVFIREMIVHHQGAVAMAELALTNAEHEEIKDLANAIISAQNTEILQMQRWQAEWYEKGIE